MAGLLMSLVFRNYEEWLRNPKKENVHFFLPFPTPDPAQIEHRMIWSSIALKLRNTFSVFLGFTFHVGNGCRCHFWVIPSKVFEEQTEMSVDGAGFFTAEREVSLQKEAVFVGTQLLPVPGRWFLNKTWTYKDVAFTSCYQSAQGRRRKNTELTVFVSTSCLFLPPCIFSFSREEWYHSEMIHSASEYRVCNSKASYYSCLDWRWC